MTPQKIFIDNNKKQKLTGYFYKNISKTIVIMCHGLEPYSSISGMEKVFEAYYHTGSSVFYFDFTGFGESEGEKTFSIKQKVFDIGNVLNYFSSEYKEIILYTVSLSGIVGAIATGKYKKITKLITVNGLFSLNIQQLYLYQALSIYTYLLSNPSRWKDMIYWVKNNKIKNITVATLVVCGEKDPLVKYHQSVNFYNNLISQQ